MQNAFQQMQIAKKSLLINPKVVGNKLCQNFKTRLQTFKTAYSFAIGNNNSKNSQKFQSNPGIHNSTAELLKLKVSPQNFKSRCCMTSLDEMSLRTALNYDMPTGSIKGFENDGKPQSKKLAISAFCVANG